ncbi:MAG: DUF1549 domain-containing protein, partial [Pirellulaceae bacterium]|nr:DUF1549 domain-containing protein [Pirellulaceae bacterium]
MRPRSAILGGLNRIFLMSTFVVFPLVTQPSARADDADQPPSPAIDYTQRIKPLLQQHCVSCHGEEKQASGLRLDVGGYLMRGGDRGAAVKAGSPAESLLYQVLFEGDDVEQMPSEEPPLPATAIATIRTWIAQGAKMPDAELAAAKLRQTSDHWAFQTIRRPAIPPLNDPWIRNPIDAFVLARLRQARLSPSAVADRGVLIRRLSLDLLGVTPAPEDVRAFANDRRPDAYERLVERMLASPRYGERWGRHWLDLARYADSNGFTIDGPRSIWKYRDWVIDAINRGDPYDDFATAQLAGDLLPDATRDQIVATGFHRNTLINQEGGTDDEQFRVEAVVDRVTTTGSVFLGLTLICAQCHEHKYDPVTQRDFYSLYAFFNNTADVNSLAPTMRLPSDRQAAEEAQVKDRIKTIQAALKEHDSKVASQQPAWEAQMKQAAAFDWQVLDPATFVSKQRATINKKEDLSLIVGGNGNIPSRDTYTVVADTKLAEVAAVRLEALTDTGLPKNGPGLADDGLFVLSELRVTASPLGADGKPGSETQLIEFTRTATDQAQAGFPSDQVIDGNEGTGWSIATTKAEGSANRDRELIAVARQS